jgi:hypothetical protein
MTALARNAITRGPGCVFWNPGAGQVALPSVGGISADVEPKEFPVNTDADGEIDKRLQDVEGKITFTPLGLLASAVTAILYPAAYRNPTIGASVFGTTDTAALVHSTAGQKVTFHSCAITAMPQLILSADKQCYGQATITAIRGTGLEWTNAAALYTIATGAYTAPNVPSANVVTQAYTAAWGALLASIVAEAGWTIDFSLGLKADPVDGYGTNDYLIESVGVVAKCRPKNLSETLLDSLKLEGSGVAIGMSRRRASNLVISGTGITVTLYDAILQRGPLSWRGTEVRAGEIAFAAQRSESAGTYGALFAIAHA